MYQVAASKLKTKGDELKAKVGNQKDGARRRMSSFNTFSLFDSQSKGPKQEIPDESR